MPDYGANDEVGDVDVDGEAKNDRAHL